MPLFAAEQRSTAGPDKMVSRRMTESRSLNAQAKAARELDQLEMQTNEVRGDPGEVPRETAEARTAPTQVHSGWALGPR